MRAIFTVIVVLALTCASALADEPDPDLFNLSLPQLTWAVQLRMHEWKMDYQEFMKDFKGRSMQASDSVSGLVVSVFIEPATKKGDAVKARDYTLKNISRLGEMVQDITTYESGRVAYFTYIFRPSEQMPEFEQRNTFALIVKDDMWVTVHLSKVGSDPDNQKQFDQFFQSVQIIENYQRIAMEYFIFAGRSYMAEDYGKAAEYYKAALDLEKVDRTLPEYFWLVTVDNLAMSYGIPGDNKKAREILDYGISLRPDYPMFHYNKACSFAEEKNLDSALHYLARANELRINMIPGETMPNPVEDESFKRYRKDDRFTALLEFWGRDSQ